MPTRRIVVSVWAIASLGLLASACGTGGGGEIAMANPSSVYCEGLGFREETRTEEAGEYGVCIFPDGSECDAWDFLAGRCRPDLTFCAQNGGTIQTDDNIGICLFADGSSCDEFAYFEGRCAPGE